MKKSALALSTAVSLLAFAPAFAQDQDMSGVDPACITTNADNTQMVDKTKCPDGKTMGQAATDQPADATGETGATANTDQNQPAGTTGSTATDATANTEQNATAPDGTAGTAESDAAANTDQPAQTMDSDTTASTTPAAPTSTEIIVPADIMNSATVMSASDYIGKRVYDKAGNDIGEVNDLIISEDGKIQATILGVGGFLGIGEKDVAVSVSSVEMVQDGSSVRLVVDATKEQLESAPTFDPGTRRYAG